MLGARGDADEGLGVAGGGASKVGPPFARSVLAALPRQPVTRVADVKVAISARAARETWRVLELVGAARLAFFANKLEAAITRSTLVVCRARGHGPDEVSVGARSTPCLAHFVDHPVAIIA